MGTIGVGPEELQAAAGQVRSANSELEAASAQLNSAKASLDATIQGALSAAQTALSQWTSGAGMASFEGASAKVKAQLTLFDENLVAAISTSQRLSQLLTEYALALDNSAQGYTGQDDRVASSFSNVQ